MITFKSLFNIDEVSVIMIALVGFIGLHVGQFSIRYLAGDHKRNAFFLKLTLLLASMFIMVIADHIFIFAIFWLASNILLTQLMLHKKNWLAALESSNLALKNFLVGFWFLSVGILSLYFATGETSIQLILKSELPPLYSRQSTFFIFLAAMTQSAIWPFHKWLISSLNSPTPVSAIMHAGLINGGGFLMYRFAPLFYAQPQLLDIIFIFGMFTAILGTLWKLMQSDIKRMLACSTMGQMGFMIVQCSLGLFSAAIAHLCWHGLFKSYLFLSSGSAAKEKRLDLNYPPRFTDFVNALFCGSFGAFAISVITKKNVWAGDTTIFLLVIAAIAGAQFSLPIIQSKKQFRLPLALIATTFFGLLYGININMIESLLNPSLTTFSRKLNLIHISGLVILILTWVSFIFLRYEMLSKKLKHLYLYLYVNLLNQSQPHEKTVTPARNMYSN